VLPAEFADGVRRVTQGNLPFTGLLLGLWALLALGLMAAGTGARAFGRLA
jgi:hypothetical protein